MLLAIDPGTNVGWALFDKTGVGVGVFGELISCGLGGEPDGAAVVHEVVIEHPVIYPGGRTKNPNDVLKVAINAGEWGGRFRHVARYVKPQQWKGNVPKAVHQPRIWAKLTNTERKVFDDCLDTAKVPKSKRHNVIDAIGIGLYAVGR